MQRAVGDLYLDLLVRCVSNLIYAGPFALIRLDGDMYESTYVALEALYPRPSLGGFIIIDDYGAIEACRSAVTDFRAELGITDEMQQVDWTARYWQKTH